MDNNATILKSLFQGAIAAAAVSTALFFGFAASSAHGDGCMLVDRQTADRAVAILRDVDRILYDDWFAPLHLGNADWTRAGFLYQVRANDNLSLDLDRVYVPSADVAAYEHLGTQLGCSGGDGPMRIPSTPFSAEPNPAHDYADDDWAPKRKLLGLLAFPELEAAWYDSTRNALPPPVEVQVTPDPAAALQAEIASITDLPTREYGYERPGAMVLEQRAGWYRLALNEGSGWVASDQAGPYHPLEEMLVDSLSYLTSVWDGAMAAAPAAPILRWLHPAWRRHMGGEVMVDVRETQWVNAELWLRLDVLWPAPCSGEDSTIIHSGWVPAYAESGSVNVWFNSRGC